MGWPQIIMIALFGVGLGIELDRHGNEKEGKHNFWITLASTCLIVSILWWGGFWS